MKEKLSDFEKILIARAVVVRPTQRQPIERYALWTVLFVLGAFIFAVYFLK